MSEMKKLWATIVGYGNRGQIYADYSLDEPSEFGVAAIVDPSDFKLQEAKKRYGLSDDRLFHNFDEFAASGIACDFVVNATMDQYHYDTAMKILNAGYDMLMEKPIVPNVDQLMDIANLAKEKKVKVFVCHVLRYTPFYRKIKELLNAGTIGEIMTMELNEHVCRPHFLSSYVRGKWNSEDACGSGFLLAKSCHDMDLICWLNNESEPTKVASFGNRSRFLPKNAPEGAAEFCQDCKHEKECPYSAVDLYLEKNDMPFLVWDRLNNTCGGDIVDRQNLIISFENGSLASFNMVGGATLAGRFIHIVGTMGEIEGVLEKNEITLRTYARECIMGKNETINVHPINNVKFGGHSGGDYAIMHDLVRYLNGDKSSISITSIEDSINGHLCVFAAEKSRKTQNFVDVKA